MLHVYIIKKYVLKSVQQPVATGNPTAVVRGPRTTAVRLRSNLFGLQFGPVAVAGCPFWGGKNRTGPDLQTLVAANIQNIGLLLVGTWRNKGT